MRVKLFLLFAMFILALNIVACTNSGNTDLSEERETDVYLPTLSEKQAGAYFTVFEDLYEKDTALQAQSTYLAIDLTNVKLADTAPLIKLMQDFCDNHGYTLLQDSFDGLTERGYIKDLYFENGFLISFNDIELDDDTLVTSASKWRSGLGAIGSEYTVKYGNNAWEITKIDKSWIS